jgi:transcriptional regulator with XRE-family HTH domain
MNYATEKIAETLKKAREQKGWSQRALSSRSGVPQSHISKIENNAVDLRISSLTAIAHALDLEIALVPRKAVPAVESVARSLRVGKTVDPTVSKELQRIERAMKSINTQPIKLEGLDVLQRNFREINQFRNLLKDSDLLHNIRTTLENIEAAGGYEAIKQAADQMRMLRNDLAHAQIPIDIDRPALPAYRLDGGDDG